jgi:signal transduction histidine kinase
VEGLAANRLRTLLEAALVLSSEREPDHVLERIVDVARDVVGARYAALAVWQAERIDDFITSGLTARDILLIGDLPKGHGLLGAVLAEGKLIRLPDLTADVRSVGFPDRHPSMRSFLGVPVDYKGEILGHLYLTEKRGAAEFTDEDELLATGLAALAATAMKNAAWAAAEQVRVAELERLDRLRRDFLAIASHELAGPTTAAVGLMHTLDAQWPTFKEEERRDLLRRALRQGRELVSRLDTALDVSRAEEGRLTIDALDIDLSDVVNAAIELLPPEAIERMQLADRPTPCRGDNKRLVRVVHNLLTNAIKYSPAASPISVELTPQPDGAELVVADHGHGFDPEDGDRLFERYYRAIGVGAPGAGLGLYVSKQIVDAHGGWIAAESDGLGTGAAFRCFIPKSVGLRMATPA